MTPQTDFLANPLHAPASWHAVDFISDIHLQVHDNKTFATWQALLSEPHENRASALFILGDLFDVWIGDDILQAAASSPDPTACNRQFVQRCARLLKAYSAHTPVFFMAGNRDFLLGTEALNHCGMTGLTDPSCLTFAGKRWLLSHGDAWCLADTEYMRFRAMARQTPWQQAFLNRPLSERERLARQWRAESEQRKAAVASQPESWADVDLQTARAALLQNQCATLIHGHTHQPGQHDLGQGLQRWVLSDWDMNAHPPRAEVTRLDAQGLQRRQLVPVIASSAASA